MDQPRKVVKPARGQLNKEIKCPWRCIRRKYIYMYCCLLLFVYQVYFLFEDMCIRARFTAVSAYMCNSVCMYVCCCFLTFSALVANPKKTTLHGGQSRSWSAEQGKKKKKSLAAPLPPPPRRKNISNISNTFVRLNRVRLQVLSYLVVFISLLKNATTLFGSYNKRNNRFT